MFSHPLHEPIKESLLPNVEKLPGILRAVYRHFGDSLALYTGIDVGQKILFFQKNFLLAKVECCFLQEKVFLFIGETAAVCSFVGWWLNCILWNTNSMILLSIFKKKTYYLFINIIVHKKNFSIPPCSFPHRIWETDLLPQGVSSPSYFQSADWSRCH